MFFGDAKGLLPCGCAVSDYASSLLVVGIQKVRGGGRSVVEVEGLCAFQDLDIGDRGALVLA